MEVKKTEKADLENKRSIFFMVGLAAALLIAILMFSWSQSEIIIEEYEAPVVYIEVEEVEITIEQEEIPRPPSPKQALQVAADILKVVDDDKQIEFDLNVDFDEDVENVFDPGNFNPDGSDGAGWNPDEIFFVVEDMPKFQGGDLNAFRAWAQRKAEYPDIARRNRITGTVTVQFVVERDGSVAQIEILNSPDKSLSDEVIRVLKSSPKWTPGKQQGAAVRIIFVIPIEFQLER